MAKKAAPIRPYWEVFHEFADSQKAMHDAGMMLHNAVDTALTLYKSHPEKAGKLLEMLTEHADRYRKAVHGDA